MEWCNVCQSLHELTTGGCWNKAFLPGNIAQTSCPHCPEILDLLRQILEKLP